MVRHVVAGHVDMLGEVFERLLAKPEAITVLGVVNDAMDDEIDEIEPIDDGMRAVAACPAAASERLCDVDETVDEEVRSGAARHRHPRMRSLTPSLRLRSHTPRVRAAREVAGLLGALHAGIQRAHRHRLLDE
jgi:hypothetical protein